MGDTADEQYQWRDRIDLNLPGVPGRGPRRTGPARCGRHARCIP